MTQDEIIRMAREAGWTQEYLEFGDVRLERFAALVAAHEREKQADQNNSIIFDASAPVVIDYSGKDYRVEAAVLAEREACAKVCDYIDTDSMIQNWKSVDECAKICAAAIRARGETK